MDTATKSGKADQTAALEGVSVSGVVGAVTSRTNEHGTFYTARIEWMGGSAFVELARDEHKKLEIGEIVTLACQVRSYVSKQGRAGHSFNYGTRV